MKIISIDVAGNPDGGWDWNEYHTVGTIDNAEFETMKKSASKILQYFYDNGYIGEDMKGKVSVLKDVDYLIIREIEDGYPLFAIKC